MIKFITEDALLEIKNNPSLLYQNVVSKSKQTLEDAFHNEKLIRETGIPSDDFQLAMPDDLLKRPELTDFENVKRVHKNMAALSESQASDERIWAAYTLSVFADYMRYRWYPDSETAMMNRYFFSYTPKRSLFRNGISRLWWIGHLTYDPGRTGDKYELTEYVCRKQDNINLLLDINFGNNPEIVKAVVQALIDAEKSGLEIDREKIRRISEYINTLGGAYLVDAFSFDDIYRKSMEKIKKLN